MEDLYLVKELNYKHKFTHQQEKDFIKMTGKSRATFFRYRKKLGLRNSLNSYKYKMVDKGICYFCLKRAVLIHHINKNRKDNKKNNLIPLCKSCHTKIHRIMINLEEAHSLITKGCETK